MSEEMMSVFAKTIMENRYAHDVNQWQDGGYKLRKETWNEIAYRVVDRVLEALPKKVSHTVQSNLRKAVRERKFMPGGRYLFASGHEFHQTQNCLLLRAVDTREGWGQLIQHCMLALMTGAGLGVNYSLLRPEGAPLGRSGGSSSGPLALMQIVNELGRGARQGGARRGAIWAGLAWDHPDVFKFIACKNWSEDLRALKARDYNAAAPMDFTNVSVCLDDDFFRAYQMPWHPKHAHARAVYWEVVNGMLRTGEPGFSVDVGQDAGEDLRNACTEITSSDDSDICNLGSINLARVDSIEEFKELVELGTLFLMAGTLYSDVPYEKVKAVRNHNRRLGLGLMGIHEWLLARGKQYGPDEELAKWLEVYKTQSRAAADTIAMHQGISRPVKVRAIAPNGTISIVAETTSSAEPLFCAAYKRRFRDGEVHKFQYVVDPTAKRLVEKGVDPDSIEDAYTLAADPERRVSFQAWLQQYVDHAISSTINLPAWGTEHNNASRVDAFGHMLIKYLPHLRGITAYPDGARGGQPLNRVSYQEAVSGAGETFIEGSDVCDITKGGSCGA